MPERSLTITIDVDSGTAKADLKAVDQGVDKIASTAKSTGAALSEYDKQVQAVVKSKQALTNTSATAAQALNATREAVQQGTSWYLQLNTAVMEGHEVHSVAIKDQQDLFGWVNRGGQGWRGYAETARDAWTALRSFDVSQLRTGLNALAESAGLTYANLGLLGTAGAVMGAAYAGWGIGRMIADFFDLDKKIGNATARLLGFGNVAAQEAGAKADVLALASKRANREITDFTEALKVNADWVQNNNARARELNDTLARLQAPEKFKQEMAGFRAEIQTLNDAGLLPALKSNLESNRFSVERLATEYRVSAGAIQLYKTELKEEEDAHKRAAAEASKHAAEQKRLDDAAEKVTKTLKEQFEHLQHLEIGHAAAAMTANEMARNLKSLSMELPKSDWQRNAEALDKWQMSAARGADTAHELLENLRGLGAELPKITTPLTAGQSIKAGIIGVGGQGGVLSQIPGMIVGGLTGGGGLEGALKGVTSAIGSVVGNSIGKTVGMLGSLGGPIGAAIGSLAGPAIDLFAKLFNNPEKQINPIREAFVQAAGGLAQLNQKAFEATGSLALVQNLLNAKNADQYKTAIDALNKAFDTQKQKVDADNTALGELLGNVQQLGAKLPPALQGAIQKLIDAGKITSDTADLFKRLTGDTTVDFKQMQDVAGKYGIDLATLGPQFQSARLHDSAATIINDFDLLKRGGTDVGTILFGMRGSISSLVQDSLKFGTDIPANMKPWIEELSRSGLLVDANGDKITDLSQLKFSDPIVTEFQKIIDKLQILIDKITGPSGVTAAVTNIPDRTIHVGWEIDRSPDIGFPGERAERFHAGGEVGRLLQFVPRAHSGLAIDERLIVAQTGEGVLSRRGMQANGGPAGLARMNSGETGGGGGGDVAVIIINGTGKTLDQQLDLVEARLRKRQKHNFRGARSAVIDAAKRTA